MATLQDILDSVRASIDRETGDDAAGTDTKLKLWINAEYKLLVRRLATLFPDRYTKYSTDIVVASGASSFDAVATATDFSKLRELQRQQGTDYVRVSLGNGINPEMSGTLCFRQRGASTIDLWPPSAAPGTYRVKYLYTPATLTGSGGGVNVDLPDGGEEMIAQLVAAKCRYRIDEDPSLHLNLRSTLWGELRDSLTPFYGAPTEGIVDVNSGTLWW